MSLLFNFTQPLFPKTWIKKTPKSFQFNEINYTVVKIKSKVFLYPGYCPHRGVNLKHATICPEKGLVCPYHSWRFSPEGQITTIGGERLSKKFKVTELKLYQDFYWIENENSPIEEQEPQLNFQGAFLRVFPVSLPLALDNFNDGTHNPSIHTTIGPAIHELEDTSFEWKKKEKSFEVSFLTPQRKTPLLFNPLFYPERLTWKIYWQTSFEPIKIRYYSEWFGKKSKKKLLPDVVNILYIAPKNKNETYMKYFVFNKPKTNSKILRYFENKIAVYYSKKVLNEDIQFFNRVGKIDPNEKNYTVDKYDGPIIYGRKLLDKYYLNKKKETDV